MMHSRPVVDWTWRGTETVKKKVLQIDIRNLQMQSSLSWL